MAAYLWVAGMQVMKKSTSSYTAARRLGVINPGQIEIESNQKQNNFNQKNILEILKSIFYIFFKAPVLALKWLWNEPKAIVLTLCLLCLPLLVGYSAMLYIPFLIDVNLWGWVVFAGFSLFTLFTISWILIWFGLLD